jgi:acyl-CoA reductase-like NAD-dependent aldehyde dehydrogenase
MTIDGKKVTTDTISESINPTTEEVLGKVPVATREHLNDAVDAAARAFPAWSATSPQKRHEILSKLSDLLAQHTEQFAELLVKEVGKPMAMA